MNISIKFLLVSASLLVAVQAHANTYSVVNHTNQDHNVKLQLLGVMEPVEDLGIAKARGGRVAASFGGTRTFLCVKHLWVGDVEPTVFSVNPQQYQEIVAFKNDPRGLDTYLRRQGLMPTILGRCGNRQFEVFNSGDRNQAVIITLN